MFKIFYFFCGIWWLWVGCRLVFGIVGSLFGVCDKVVVCKIGVYYIFDGFLGY